MSENKLITKKTNKGLLPEEFQQIEKNLGRVPNSLETEIFESFWSEKSTYKYSNQWLKKLSEKDSEFVYTPQNKTAVKITDDLYCMINMQSHNRLVSTLPYEGAGAVVGAAHRKLYTNGFRPIGQIGIYRFGVPSNENVQNAMRATLRGSGEYSNVLNIPTLKNDVFFHETFNNNPIINTFSIGISTKLPQVSLTKKDGIVVFLAGAETGNSQIKKIVDEIANSPENMPKDLLPTFETDALQENLLTEMVLEAYNEGVALYFQHIGDGGLANALPRIAQTIKSGIKISLENIHHTLLQTNIANLLFSETPGRILIAVAPEKTNSLVELFEKWDVTFSELGKTTTEPNICVKFNGEKIVDLPIETLMVNYDLASYVKEKKEAPSYERTKGFDIDAIPEPKDLREIAWKMIKNPNLASRKWFDQQCDSTVGTINLTSNFPSEAAVINIKNTDMALMMSVAGNPRYLKADPKRGTEIALSEAFRNIICCGGKPIAMFQHFNFGNLNSPEVCWDFNQVIEGLHDAELQYNIPSLGNNLSFSNFTDSEFSEHNIAPTPIIGMVGVIKNKNNHTTISFKGKGHMIYLIGESTDDISSSEYLATYHGIENTPPPHFDLKTAFYLQQILAELIDKRLVSSAHDVASGGIFKTLIDCSMPNRLGFDITADAEHRTDAFLFGESQNRIIVSVSPAKEIDFVDFMIEKKFPFSTLGHVTKGEMRIDDLSYGFIRDATKEYNNALSHIIEK